MGTKDTSEYLNKIFLGEIASVHNYGAFVRIPGGSCQGLVHRTQVSSSSVEDVTEVLRKGDRVWCKVVKITDDGKLSLSMKVVNQGNGTDLDPNGVQMHQDELKRRSRPEKGGRKAITLEAVLNTTCTKCGTKGHLSKDCFKSPDGKTYELIPEDDETDNPSTLTSQKTAEEEQAGQEKIRQKAEVKRLRKKMKKLKKKEKKMKEKRKKKKKRHSSSSSSSSEDGSSSEDSEEEKLKRKKKSDTRRKLKSRSRSPIHKHK